MPVYPHAVFQSPDGDCFNFYGKSTYYYVFESVFQSPRKAPPKGPPLPWSGGSRPLLGSGTSLVRPDAAQLGGLFLKGRN
jgi:hypothetical protein